MIENRQTGYIESSEEALGRLMDDPYLLYFAHKDSFPGNTEVVPLKLQVNHLTLSLSNKHNQLLKPQDALYGNLGFALQRDSEFTGIVQYALLKMKESGIFKKIRQKWIENSPKLNEPNNEGMTLGYNNLLFPFSLILFGITIAALIAILEKFKAYL